MFSSRAILAQSARKECLNQILKSRPEYALTLADSAPIPQEVLDGVRVVPEHFPSVLACAVDSVGFFHEVPQRQHPQSELLAELASGQARLDRVVESHFAVLEPVLSVGPFQRHLPDECRRRVVAELMHVPAFQRWLRTRHVWEMAQDDSRWTHVQTALLA